MKTELSSSRRLSILTPTIRGRDCEELSEAISGVLDRWEVVWWVCPNADGWEANLPDFCHTLPLRFSEGVPLLSRINQARELLRYSASEVPADSVLWLDDDMVPDSETIDSLASTSIRGDTQGLLVAPIMRNRHTRDSYTCAWVYGESPLIVNGRVSEFFVTEVSFLPTAVEGEGARFVWAHGVGLGCCAHPWSFLREFCFPPEDMGDDEWMSRMFSISGRSGIVVDYSLHVGHKG